MSKGPSRVQSIAFLIITVLFPSVVISSHTSPNDGERMVDSSRDSLWDKLTLDQLKHLAAGGVAGAVSRTCVSPLERMKILYQVSHFYIMLTFDKCCHGITKTCICLPILPFNWFLQ